MHAGEEIRVTEPRHGALALPLEAREGAERVARGYSEGAVLHQQRLERPPDPASQSIRVP